MKPVVGLLFMAIGIPAVASAKEIRGYGCYSQCLAFDAESKELQLLGEVEGFAEKRTTAWKRVQSSCKTKARRSGFGERASVVLVKGEYSFSMSDQHSSEESEAFADELTSWSYADSASELEQSISMRRPFLSYTAEARVVRSSTGRRGKARSTRYRYYRFDMTREMSLKVELDSSSSCDRESFAEEDLVPVYEGDLPVLG